MPRRRDRESSSSSDSSSSGDDGPPQEPWLINQQKRGGYTVLKSGAHRYDEWCGLDKHGEKVTYPGNGAYYPEGYQPNWQQAKPFRCPVMDCHKACEFPHQVGNHFRMKHRKALLFDTRNGKFTVIGKKRVPTDKENRNGRCKWAPVVVKRAPNPGWQAVAQAQQVQVQQAAPAPVVQPAAAAAAPAPAPVPQPVLGRAPPARAGNGAPSSSAPAALVASAIPPPGSAIRPADQLPLPLRELPAAAANNRANNNNRRNNGGPNRRNNSNRAADFTKPKNTSIWDYINTFTPAPLPLPLDTCLLTLLSQPRVCALPKCWKHRLHTSSPSPSSPSPTPTSPASISPFYSPSNLSRSGLDFAGPSGGPSNNSNNANNNENNNSDSSGPLTLKDLNSLALYLSRKDSTTPCNTPHCPVGKLSHARFDEINKRFNEGSTKIHNDMAFPKCKGLREEELTGESEGARAVRERFGEFGGCVNAYWAEGEEVELGEVVMEDA